MEDVKEEMQLNRGISGINRIPSIKIYISLIILSLALLRSPEISFLYSSFIFK